ncbi:DegV family EDD domain-containing protein [Cellulosimicrobium sp. BIT-GX5]|uniref:DegV family EDD domain-containing protein n=1 Tax=Cellulosimicrobium composti TaxID=2672572 RepID=A0A6N7ZJZ2_9MICO|nr:DegV family protein [Cellulosimicrobium composti]MTG89558.1 DegV family EDD domain-containing protein [Cellulosimicrobium composti]
MTDHRVHVVTDSTASLPPGTAERLRSVPLHVVVDGEPHLENVGLTAEDVAAHLQAGHRVTTSQPTPRAFGEAYAAAAAAGAREIVSVHLSGELSGTVHAAALAASDAPVPVRVVDSRTVAMGLGFAARAAADAAAAGAPTDVVARRAIEVADASRAVFLVDSLDHLRRGGRLSAAAAALGTVLGVRPLLAVREGRIEVVQKVRTRTAAVERLTTVAVDSAGRRTRPALAVHHVGDDDGAHRLAAELTDRTGLDAVVTPVSAVLGAHVGPGVLAVVVADLADRGSGVADLVPLR